MWWFKKTLPDPERLTKLEESFEKLRRQMAGLELEWTDTLDRVKRLMGRIAKRADVVERAEAQTHVGAGEIEAGDSAGSNPGPQLTPSQLSIQARILARRNRRPIHTGEAT